MASPGNETYGFNKQDARALLAGIGNGDTIFPEMRPRGYGNNGAIFKTPVDGIPGRTSLALGSAVCTRYTIDDSGNLVSGDNFTVYSFVSGNIGKDVYITAKKVSGKWVADAEDCG